MIDLFEKYKYVVKREGLYFDHISNFDDRFNEPEHNKLNYAEICRTFSHVFDEQGRTVADKIIPVTHNRDVAPAEFFEYAQADAKLIAVGSKPMVTDEQWEAIDGVRTDMGVRVHRFGNMKFDDLVKYRLNSADSTRYARAGMYGRDIWFWDDEINRPVNIDLRSNEVTSRHIEFLKVIFGFRLNDIIAHVDLLWVVNMYCTQKVQAYLTDVLGIE